MKKHTLTEIVQGYLNYGQKQMKFNHGIDIPDADMIDMLIRLLARYSDRIAEIIKEG